MLLRRPNVLATKVYFASGITLDNYFFPPMGKVALIETRSSSGSIDLYVSEPGDVHFQLLKVARIGSERRAIKWRGNDFRNFRLNEPNPGKGNSADRSRRRRGRVQSTANNKFPIWRRIEELNQHFEQKKLSKTIKKHDKALSHSDLFAHVNEP